MKMEKKARLFPLLQQLLTKTLLLMRPFMSINNLSIGNNPPDELNAIIEVPKGGATIKYEMDKQSAILVVDRRLHTPMFYPAHYGFIPHTLSSDGDPLDILVVEQEDLVPGCAIAVRPVGVLLMEDESGTDEKILSVPATHIDPQYKNINNYTDLPESFIEEITHFFEHYKDLEKNKWVKIIGWENINTAKQIIKKAMIAFSKEK
jgi:inorganic pyrophosphatase